MKIIVASQNSIKINAVKKALYLLGIKAQVIGVNSASGIPEQPMNEETLHGAENRAARAREQISDANLYIAIENGIFSENGVFFDKAVILGQTADGSKSVTYSEGTECPREYVEEAQKIGLNNTTVGALMLAAKKTNDPEFAEIAETRRMSTIVNAVIDSLKQLNLPDLIQQHTR